MKKIVIPGGDVFNEKTQRFEKISPCVLKLEHSLLSLDKWESKHHVPFLENEHTNDEIIDYIKCMTLNQDQVDDKYYNFLTAENIREIKDYIADPMTATTFYDPYAKNNNGSKEIVTAECIYSSMIILGIPIEIFEKRHLNKLITLIKVCKEQQNPDNGSNKVNQQDVMRHYSELNRARIAASKKGKL